MNKMNEKICYIVRGVPGSGKTTFAETLGVPVLSADDYFMVDGEYRFNPNKLKDAHADCQRRAKAMFEAGRRFAVANTFTREWEMKPYLDMAEEYGYTIFSLVVENRHGRGNVHGVPDHAVEKMRKRFEIKL